eukprot:985988-Karenia_brevis.AAC.1
MDVDNDEAGPPPLGTTAGTQDGAHQQPATPSSAPLSQITPDGTSTQAQPPQVPSRPRVFCPVAGCPDSQPTANGWLN